MRVLLDHLGELGDDRLALLVVDAFADRDHAATVLLERRLHVGQEVVDRENPLGQVDEMRPVIGILARQRGGRRQEAGVPAHDDRAIDALQRVVVEIGAHEGLNHEARGGRETRRVIEADEIVVDGLRDVNGVDADALPRRLLGDDPHGVGGIVAADVEEGVDVVRAQHLEDFLAIFAVGLVAGRAERRGRAGGDRFEIGSRSRGRGRSSPR